MKKEIIKILLGFNILLIIFIIFAIKSFNINTNTFYLSLGYIIIDILYQIQLLQDIKRISKQFNI